MYTHAHGAGIWLDGHEPFPVPEFCYESAAMVGTEAHANRKWVYVNISVHKSTIVTHAHLFVNP